MANDRSFTEMTKLQDMQRRYDGAEIWGGAFWEMRLRIGQKVIDPFLVRAWFSSLKSAPPLKPESFIRAFLREVESSSSDNARVARDILRKRGFPTG
jgi:hypothetical protein